MLDGEKRQASVITLYKCNDKKKLIGNGTGASNCLIDVCPNSYSRRQSDIERRFLS